MRRILLPSMEPEQVADEIGEFILERVVRMGATGCAIGLSGGVDSTTTAALIQRKFTQHNAAHNTSFELVGYMLPSGTNHSSDTEDGAMVAKRLGIRYEQLSIEPLLQAYKHTNPEAFAKNYDKGNLTSRVRATVLNTKAATENKVLAGTGNKDEDFGIGYYTLFGDGAVHMSPIAGLSKRLVRQMASYLSFDDLAKREPAAGLEPQQTDFRDLGYRYDVVEIVTEGLSQGFTPSELYAHLQVAPLVCEQMQAYQRTYGVPKFTTINAVVEDIVKRNRIAQAKAEVIHPPAPKVTLRYE